MSKSLSSPTRRGPAKHKPTGGVWKPREAGWLPLVCLPARSCCPEVATATSTECQTYDEHRVSRVPNVGNPTHGLRGMEKKKKNVEEVASGRAVSLASLRICKKCPAGGSRERMSGLRGMRHLKGVRDLGSCKLRPGDFQAVVVRKRFHKGSYNVSILSPPPLLGPRAAPLPPFPGSPAAVAVRISFFWAGPPLLPEPLKFAAVSTRQGWQLLSACEGEEGTEDRRWKRPQGEGPHLSGLGHPDPRLKSCGGSH